MLFRRILVPVDFSDRSLPALRVAFELARDVPGARVTIFHVSTPQAPLATGDFRPLLAAADHGGVPVETVETEGDPAEKIVALAREERFDTIIIGTRRRMGVADYLLGSVAMRVLARAPCPVIAISPDMDTSAARTSEPDRFDTHPLVD